MTGKANENGPKSETALREEEVLKFWADNKIFEKSLAKDSPKGEFVFYEGPPTANAKPALHHLEARAFKDAIPRYKTMQGYHVRRKAGWDTHGLPVELQIEKELGFTGKQDIEKYGVEAFNEKCRESVFRYIGVWETFTDRIGYWVDKSDAYYTFSPTYMESLWHITKKVADDGRLYKDYKVVPWCSRCGTALSSHELAQGYKDVKDLSVTAKFELVDEPGTYLLAWTTTPWTLPGNVGLAVGAKIDYVTIEKDGQKYILAKERLSIIEGEHKVVAEQKGSALVGKAYKPLYPYLAALVEGSEKEKLGNAYKVYAADFVTTTDGTGIVHTAVMYGADDFDLGTEVGLPKVHLVKPDGKFVEGTDFLAGRFVKEQDDKGKPTLAVDIIDDLKKRGLYFSQENVTHTYPFCWRCSTPLIYYARDSWYIRMTELRDQLIAENQTINWEPSHIRDGRFGEWLSGVKDWAISRERYWGTPLPVWLSADGKEQIVIGSVDDIRKRVKKSGNTYFLARHGESTKNIIKILRSELADDDVHLTEKGVAQARAIGVALKDKGIDLIYVSPFIRTKETAEGARAELGLPTNALIVDGRLHEHRVGVYDKGPDKELEADFAAHRTTDYAPEGGESVMDIQRRAGEFLYELERTHQNKKILIVTHGWPAAQLLAIARGVDAKESFRMALEEQPEPGVVQELPFVPLPHNKDYELDLHKPYIDQVTLIGDSGAELKRTGEVMDVWFDSGAMPFAQEHYPFATTDIPYPADFISEAIDQTRGWFYTLLAVGVLMGRGTPYKNVICLGHLLDDKGAKMSKSKGNVVEPFAAMDTHGADLLRYWMYSVNAPGDGKSYDEKVLAEVRNKVFNPFLNSVQFYELYKDDVGEVSTAHVLDRWMQSRLNAAQRVATDALEKYDMYTATREIRDLIGDVSLWFVRRSRDRVKEGGEDAHAAAAMLRHTLVTVAKFLAPFAPFVAEQMYQKLKTTSEPESVHLTAWPEAGEVDEELLKEMKEVRELVSLALEMRQKSSIKVRQPLQKLTVNSSVLIGKDELLELIKQELNVKEVVADQSNVERVLLDTTITDSLREEGELRDLMREVQDLRKTAGLNPKDQATLVVDEAHQAAVAKHWDKLAKATGLKGQELGPTFGVHA
ncbi:MAG: class I tRNA ligase family protein [Patescibacteria group bacterium]